MNNKKNNNTKKKYVRYSKFQGKYVYIVYKYDEDFPTYIGYTENIKRRYMEHMRSKRGSGFAKKIPRYIRQRDYKFEVYDFSNYKEINRSDLRLLEAFVTHNMDAEFSKPKRLTKKDRIRIEELRVITEGIKLKSYEVIVKERAV